MHVYSKLLEQGPIKYLYKLQAIWAFNYMIPISIASSWIL